MSSCASIGVLDFQKLGACMATPSDAAAAGQPVTTTAVGGTDADDGVFDPTSPDAQWDIMRAKAVKDATNAGPAKARHLNRVELRCVINMFANAGVVLVFAIPMVIVTVDVVAGSNNRTPT